MGNMFFKGPSGWGTSTPAPAPTGLGLMIGGVHYIDENDFWAKNPGATSMPTPDGAAPGAAPTGGNIPSGGGTSSGFGVSGSGPGQYNIDAQIAAMNKSYADSLKKQLGGAREAQNIRGIFTGDFSAQEDKDITGRSEAERLAAEERLRNQKGEFDFRQWATEQEFARQQELDKQQKYSGATYSSKAGESSELADLLMKLSQGQGGGITGPGSGYQGPGATHSSKSPTGTPTAAAAPSRRDASSDYYKKYGTWPTPAQLDAYMAGVEGPVAPGYTL